MSAHDWDDRDPSDRACTAIASWTRFDPNDDPGRSPGRMGALRYVCHQCDFHGVAELPAANHASSTGHLVTLAYRPTMKVRRG